MTMLERVEADDPTEPKDREGWKLAFEEKVEADDPTETAVAAPFRA